MTHHTGATRDQTRPRKDPGYQSLVAVCEQGQKKKNHMMLIIHTHPRILDGKREKAIASPPLKTESLGEGNSFTSRTSRWLGVR